MATGISTYADFFDSSTMTTVSDPFKIENCPDVDFLYGPYYHKDGDPYYITINENDEDDEGQPIVIPKYYNNSFPSGTYTQPESGAAGVDGNYESDRDYAIALARFVLSNAGCLKDGRLFSIKDDGGHIEIISVSGNDTSLGSVMTMPSESFESEGVMVYSNGSVSISDEYVTVNDLDNYVTENDLSVYALDASLNDYLKKDDASTALRDFENPPIDEQDASSIYTTQRWVVNYVDPITGKVDDVSMRLGDVATIAGELKMDVSSLSSDVVDLSTGYSVISNRVDVIDTCIGDMVTQEMIDDTLSYYVRESSLDASLAFYVTNSSFNETVELIDASLSYIESSYVPVSEYNHYFEIAVQDDSTFAAAVERKVEDMDITAGFLSKVEAASTYLTILDASLAYMTEDDASSMFAGKDDLSIYALDASLLDYAKKTDLSVYVTDSSFIETVETIETSIGYIDSCLSSFALKNDLSVYVPNSSFIETVSLIDASLSAIESSISTMVTENDLSVYAKDASLSDYLLMSDFNTIMESVDASLIEISDALPTFATTEFVNTELAGYVTNSSFNATVSSIDSSISDLSTAIPLLATKAELTDYATVASLSAYVTDSSLTETLSDYVTTEDASEMFTGMLMCDMSIGYSENDIQGTDASGNIVYGPNPAISVSCDKSISDIVDAHDSGRMVYCKVYDTRTNPNPANKIEPSYDVPLMMTKVVETYNESVGITVVTKIALFKLFYDNNEIQFYGSYSYQKGNEENNSGDIWSLNYSQSVYESPANKSDVITETPKPYQYPSISAVTDYTAGSVDVEFKSMTRRHAFYINYNIMYRNGVNVECDGSVSDIVDRFNSGSSVSGHITDYSKILVEGYYDDSNDIFYYDSEYQNPISCDEEHIYKDLSASFKSISSSSKYDYEGYYNSNDGHFYMEYDGSVYSIRMQEVNNKIYKDISNNNFYSFINLYTFNQEHYDYLLQYGTYTLGGVAVTSPEPNVSGYYNSEDMLFYTDSSFNMRCTDVEYRYYMDIPSEGLYAFVSSCFVPCEIEGILINRGGIQLSNANVTERGNTKRVDMIYFGNNVQISFLGTNTNSSDTDIWSMNINEKCFEDAVNKVTEISKASDDLYPSVSAVMNYVSSNVSSEVSSRLLTVDASISALDASVMNMVTANDLSIYAKDASLTDKVDASISSVSLETIAQVLNKVIIALNSYTSGNISSITFNSDGVYFSNDVSTSSLLNGATNGYVSTHAQSQSSGGLS